MMPKRLSTILLLAILLLIAAAASVQAQPHADGARYDVRAFGAVADDGALDTQALQAALDTAHARGGGTVVVPGGTFVSGTLRLRSHVELHLTPGAVLQGSTEMADYDTQAPHLLFGDGVENVALTGTGLIDGQGHAFWREKPGPDTDLIADDDARPYRFIRFHEARHVTVRDLRIKNSPSHTLRFEGSRYVTIDGVRMDSDLRGPNTDGINLQGTSDVAISNCHIRTGDDAIVLKADRPTENITVTGCYLESDDAAIKFGTGSRTRTANVVMSNLVIRDSRYGISLFMGEGGVYENVRFENIVMETGSRHKTEYPIYIDLDRETPQDDFGTVRNVTFRGLDITTRGNILVAGNPQKAVEDLVFEDIQMTVRGGVDLSGMSKPQGNKDHRLNDQSVDLAPVPAHVTLGYAENITLRDVTIRTDRRAAQADRHAVYAEGVRGLVLDGLAAHPARAESDKAAVHLVDTGDALVTQSRALPGTGTFLRVEGTPPAPVRLFSNLLHDAETAVSRGDDVPAAMVVGEGIRAALSQDAER